MTTMSSEFLYYQLVFSAINTVQVFFFVFRRWRRFDRLWRSRLSTGLDADVLYETLCFYRLLSHYDPGCDLEWGQSCWSSQLLEPVLTLVRYWWWIEKRVSLSIVALLLRMFMPKPFTSWCKSSKQRVRRWTHHYISNSVFLAYIFINKMISIGNGVLSYFRKGYFVVPNVIFDLSIWLSLSHLSPWLFLL